MSSFGSTTCLYPFDLSLSHKDEYHEMGFFHFSDNKTTNHSNSDILDIQQWLIQGLIWYYAFNHEEAIYCFQQAISIDSNCVMAYYGISISNGPNYNSKYMTRDSFPSATEAYRNSQHANNILLEYPEIKASLSNVEILLIEALACRFNNIETIDLNEIEIKQNTELYTIALSKVYEEHPNDPNVACMYAESLMNYDPWRLWDLNTGIPQSFAMVAYDVLLKGLAIAPKHPGLNHFMIHLMEMSPTPEKALPACKVLQSYFPSAGHLVHMPSHIYVLLGMWMEAMTANIQASIADAIYVKKEGIYNCYTGYRIHNLHFIAYAAMFAGRSKEAMNAIIEIKNNLPDELLINPIMRKYFESFLAIEYHVLIRFGQWENILSKSLPINQELHPNTYATHFYAQGIASAVLGDIYNATENLKQLKLATTKVPKEHVLHNNYCIDLLEIAEHMLSGEILYRKGSYQDGFWELEMAARLSDELVYDEPWGWMQPPSHALGALMLEQQMFEKAEYWFRKDMDRNIYGRCHPDNIWATTGLLDCLQQKLDLYIKHNNDANNNDNMYSEDKITELQNEIIFLKDKIATIQVNSDSQINVACMCAVKKSIISSKLNHCCS